MPICNCQLLAIWCDMRFVEWRALQDTPLLTFGQVGSWPTAHRALRHLPRGSSSFVSDCQLPCVVDPKLTQMRATSTKQTLAIKGFFLHSLCKFD